MFFGSAGNWLWLGDESVPSVGAVSEMQQCQFMSYMKTTEVV